MSVNTEKENLFRLDENAFCIRFDNDIIVSLSPYSADNKIAHESESLTILAMSVDDDDGNTVSVMATHVDPKSLASLFMAIAMNNRKGINSGDWASANVQVQP